MDKMFIFICFALANAFVEYPVICTEMSNATCCSTIKKALCNAEKTCKVTYDRHVCRIEKPEIECFLENECIVNIKIHKREGSVWMTFVFLTLFSIGLICCPRLTTVAFILNLVYDNDEETWYDC